jgi:hypothetical protein
MAGKQFGLAIRRRDTKKVTQKVWFPSEANRDEAMENTKLDADHEFSREEKDCQLDPQKAKPGEWIALP